MAPARQLDWVVYAKPPFGGAEQVIEYLGRYTHRIALSNQRLLAFQDGQVTFQYNDYSSTDPQRSRQMTASADEFVRRFLLHVIPPGFQRIRHYGLLTNRYRAEKLVRCRELLVGPRSDLLPTGGQIATILALIVEPVARCPRCKAGIMIRVPRSPLSPGPLSQALWTAPAENNGIRVACVLAFPTSRPMPSRFAELAVVCMPKPFERPGPRVSTFFAPTNSPGPSLGNSQPFVPLFRSR